MIVSVAIIASLLEKLLLQLLLVIVIFAVIWWENLPAIISAYKMAQAGLIL